MRTRDVVGVVLCFGLAFSLLSGSGIGAVVFAESPDGDQTTRALDDIADDADLEEDEENSGFVASVFGDNEPTIIGLVLEAGQFFTGLAVAVALLPVTLIELGLPSYAAIPLGSIAQIIAFVGVAQFITGREFL